MPFPTPRSLYNASLESAVAISVNRSENRKQEKTMSVNKAELNGQRWRNALTVSGLSGKSVTGVEVYQHGATEVCEIQFSGGQTYIKFKQGLVEIGGTAEWNTGTQV
jgi:hypothetical protein